MTANKIMTLGCSYFSRSKVSPPMGILVDECTQHQGRLRGCFRLFLDLLIQSLLGTDNRYVMHALKQGR